MLRDPESDLVLLKHLALLAETPAGLALREWLSSRVAEIERQAITRPADEPHLRGRGAGLLEALEKIEGARAALEERDKPLAFKAGSQ